MGWRITPFGVLVLVALVGGCILAIAASGSLQVVGFVAAVLAVLLLASQGMSAGRSPGASARKSEVALQRFRSSQPPPDLGPTNSPERRDELWARERERREQTR